MRVVPVRLRVSCFAVFLPTIVICHTPGCGGLQEAGFETAGDFVDGVAQAEDALSTGAVADWVRTASLLPDDDDGYGLGRALSVTADGTHALVSSFGRAVSYSWNGVDWTRQATIENDVVAANADFGRSLAQSADGTTAVIGAPLEDVGGLTNAGTAIVFSKSGNEWVQVAQLFTDEPIHVARFGSDVSIDESGHTVLIGSYAGAHVFSDDGGTWSLVAELNTPEAGALNVVELQRDGQRALASGEGRAFVFDQVNGIWSDEAELVPISPDTPSPYGGPLAISADGSHAVVGAPSESSLWLSKGAAYIFRNDGAGVWTQEARLLPDPHVEFQDDINFGLGLVIDESGETIAVASRVDGFLGYVYRFSRAGTTWTKVQKPSVGGVHSLGMNDAGTRVFVGNPQWGDDAGIVHILDSLIDECADGIAMCDENATCTDTVDAYGCECNSGYTGDGTTCAVNLESQPCDAPEITSVSYSGLFERNPAAWPVSAVCNGISTSNEGFASMDGNDSGFLSFELAAPSEISSVRLFNDFGSLGGQGVRTLLITFVDIDGTIVFGPVTWETLPENQRVGNGPDILSPAAPVPGVARVDIDLFDNFVASGAAYDQLNIREFEFALVTSSPTIVRPCGASGISSVSTSSFSERNPSRWPLEALCDGSGDVNDGFASGTGETSGLISFELDSVSDIEGVRLYNDYGSLDGQGAKSMLLHFYNESGQLIVGNVSAVADENNQLVPNGPDILAFGLVTDVKRIDVEVLDNFQNGGPFNELNIREIEFMVRLPTSVDQRTCSGSLFQSVDSIGLQERDPGRWPIEKICDGVTSANDGMVTDGNDAGWLEFTFASDQTVSAVLLYNDFGMQSGQGAASLDVTLLDASENVLSGPHSFSADESNQLVGNGPDVFAFPTVSGVRRVRVVIAENFLPQGSPFDELNIREIDVIIE